MSPGTPICSNLVQDEPLMSRKSNQVNFKPTCHIYHPTPTSNPRKESRTVHSLWASLQQFNCKLPGYRQFHIEVEEPIVLPFRKILRSFSRFVCCINFGKAKTRGERNQLVKISLPKLTSIFGSGNYTNTTILKSAVAPPNITTTYQIEKST